ncbi:MAG: hypothetical protein JW726_04095 [Anaerolineales bacterium]|nr:hypothetical protein [Anaerolineales bacterium]
MQSQNQIRFIATNYYNLQGLRAIPLGLLLILVCLWANGLDGPARNFLLPVSAVVSSLLLLIAIDRYYLRTFGQVRRTPESLRLEWLVGIVGGILALGAYLLDISHELPLSLLGLVFAAGLLADYIRITWLVKGRFLFYYPLGATLMAVVSVLPLVGIRDWWQTVGLASQMLGIAVAIGIFSVIAGIWGHIFLLRTLPTHKGGEE